MCRMRQCCRRKLIIFFRGKRIKLEIKAELNIRRNDIYMADEDFWGVEGRSVLSVGWLSFFGYCVVEERGLGFVSV